MFLADDTKLGEPWDLPSGKGEHQRLFLDRAGLDMFADERIGRALASSRIMMDEESGDRNARLNGRVCSIPLRALDYKLGSNFKSVEPHYIHFTRPVNTAWLLIDNFPILSVALHLLNPPGIWDETGLSSVRTRFSNAVRDGRTDSDDETAKLWDGPSVPSAKSTAEARGIVANSVREQVGTEITEHASNLSTRRKPEDGTLEAALRLRLFYDVNPQDALEWRKVRQGLARIIHQG